MAAAAKKTAQVRRRKELKKVDKGQVHIQSSFNNTLVTITDMNGNTISWSSAGSLNFKGSRKGTPFAAQMAADTAAKAAKPSSPNEKGNPSARSSPFPATVHTIGAEAFAACGSLTSVYFEGDPQNLGNNIFPCGEQTGAVLTIYGTAGGSVEAYAQASGIPFEIWNASDNTAF